MKKIIIRKSSGAVLRTVIVTKDAIKVKELMGDDYIQLSWADNKGDDLPVGAYIEYNNIKYTLDAIYTPTQRDEGEWKYEPQFQSPVAMLGKRIFFLYQTDTAGVEERIAEWTITDSPAKMVQHVADALNKEFAEEIDAGVEPTWEGVAASDLTGTQTLQFSATDFLSALSEIAEAFETEWRIDYGNHVIYLGKAEFTKAPTQTLEVGVNVGAPTISESKKKYFNRFYVYGSTRNITQDYNAANVNSMTSKRLTLDPDNYPESYIDTRASDAEPILQTVLTFDEVYPKSSLVVIEARPRIMYVLESGTNNRIQIGTDKNGNPIYDQYTIWYLQLGMKGTDGVVTPFRLANTDIYSKDNPEGVLIANKTLSIHFQSGALNGREFELAYHKEALTVSSTDGVSFQVKVGDFEIIYTKENDFIIPAMTGIVPAEDDKVILFNLRLPDEYIQSAYVELEASAEAKIAEYNSDTNNYELQSYPVRFSVNANLQSLEPGQKVIYKNGSYTFNTRVIRIEQKLDIPAEMTVTLGNKQIKGTTQTLKEDVANANKDINLIVAFNDLTQATINNYNRAITAMVEGFDKIAKMWRFHPTLDNVIITPYNVISEQNVVAFGTEDGELPDDIKQLLVNYVTQDELKAAIEGVSGGGLDIAQLELYLKANKYATQEWVSTNFNKYTLTKAEVEAVLTGDITTHTHSQYITSAMLASASVGKADKLATPRKLWGQTFDGSADVSGDMVGIAGGIAIHNSNEINSFTDNLYLNNCGDGDSSLGTTADVIICGNGGNVGVGVSEPKAALHVLGDILASGNVSALSDERVKTKIKRLKYRGNLEPKAYIKDGKRELGFIAQEVKALYPELVFETHDERNLLALNYSGITAVLAAQVNRLQEKINRLENLIKNGK